MMNRPIIGGSLISFLCLWFSLQAEAQTIQINFRQSLSGRQIFHVEGYTPITITDTNRTVSLSPSKPVFGFLNTLPVYLIPGQSIEITDQQVTGLADNEKLFTLHRLWQQLLDSLQSKKWPEGGYNYRWIKKYKKYSRQLIQTFEQAQTKEMATLFYQIQQLEMTRYYYLYTGDSLRKRKHLRQSLAECDLNHPTLDHCYSQIYSNLLTNLHLVLLSIGHLSAQDQPTFFRYLMKHTHNHGLITTGVIDGYIQALSQEGPSQSLLDIHPEIQNYLKKNRYDTQKLDREFQNYLRLSEGQTAPTFTFPDQQGKLWSLQDFRGKVLVVDIWATWCGGCVYGLPEYAKFREKMKTNPDIEFITISLDRKDQIPESRKILDKAGLSQAVNLSDLSYSPDFRKDYHINYIPRCLIIDRQGKIVNVYAPAPHMPAFREWLDKALKKL